METIALGVDGMEPTLCDRWIDDGELPNLAEIEADGAYGTASCSSLISAEQWTTHFTGVNPDQHGVTGFIRREEVEHGRDENPHTRISPESKKLINLGDVRVKTYPELLSEAGVTAGLINPLPIWPPLELDGGFCIAGLVTPPTASSYTYPESLQGDLEEMGYRIDVRYGDRPYGFIDDLLFEDDEVELDALKADMFDVLETRIEYTKRAVRSDDVEFLYSLLKSVDVIQHTFWGHMAASSTEYEDTILDCYRRIDELVGWIRDARPEANLVIFGDHGFGPRRDPRVGFVHSIGYLIDTYVELPYAVKALYRRLLKSEADVDLTDLDGITGDHSEPTACMMAGPDVVAGTSLDVAFEDLTPTIMTLLGEPVPSDYVGSVPTGAVRPTPDRRDVSLRVTRDRPATSEEVSERLYNLGYAEMVDDS